MCQNRGHYAMICPTKQVIKLTSLELNMNNLKEDANLVKSVSKLPKASIIHLSLSNNVETGTGAMEKHMNIGKEPQVSIITKDQ